MFKRILLAFIIIFSFAQMTIAKDIPVKIKTLSKISTSNNKLREGDNINFVIAQDVCINSKLYLKAGSPVIGVITNLIDNNFTCQEASIYAENFKTKDVNGKTVKLKGIVYKKGRNHWMLTQFLVGVYIFIRGGEAQIIPNKDFFCLYLEANND